MRALPLAAIAVGLALATKRGRGMIGGALVSAGVRLIPAPPPDPEREARIRRAVYAGIAAMEAGSRTRGDGSPI